MITGDAKTNLIDLLGNTTETLRFINETERAVSTYFAIKQGLADVLTSNQLVDRFKKVKSNSKTLNKTIQSIPVGEWSLLGQHWFLKNGKPLPFTQLELDLFLRDLAISANDAMEACEVDTKPGTKARGRKKDSAMAMFIDHLIIAFESCYEKHPWKVSRKTSSYFYSAVVIIMEGSEIDRSTYAERPNPSEAIKNALSRRKINTPDR